MQTEHSHRFRPPAPARDLVARPHLLSRLSNGLQDDLILISAPAGSGKSTIAAMWVRSLTAPQEGAPTQLQWAWLSIDRSDNQEQTFVLDLISAVASAIPESLTDVSPRFECLSATSAPSVLRDLLARLDALQANLVLVLDDYHLVTSQHVHNLVRDILQRRPTGLHLLITTRSDPPVGVAQLRARGRLTELRSRELSFSPEESALFLHADAEDRTGEEVARRLHDATEGWPAGMRLAAISLRESAPGAEVTSASLAHSNSYVMDYLSEDVLAALPPHLERFAVRTSILREFDARLCSATLGDMSPAECHMALDQLDRFGLILVTLDERPGSYRYHNLLRAFFLRRLAETATPMEIQALHRRAAVQLEAQQAVHAAIGHWLENGEEIEAARAIERSLARVIETEAWPDVERWIALLPAAILGSRPGMLLAQAFLAVWQYRAEDAAQLLASAEAVLRSSPLDDTAPLNPLWEQMLAALSTSLEHYHLGADEQLARFDRALAALPEPTWLRGYVIQNQMIYLVQAGRVDEADRRFREAILGAPRDPGPFAARLYHAMGVLCYWTCRLAEGEEIGRRYADVAKACGLSSALAWVNVGLGDVALQHGDTALAAKYLDHVLQTDSAAQPEALLMAASRMLAIYLEQGKLAEAEQMVRSLSSFADRVRSPALRTGISGLEAYLAFGRGETGVAMQWAAACNVPDPVNDASLFVTRVMIWMAVGTEESLSHAVLALNDALSKARRRHHVRGEIRYGALLARALWLQKQRRRALAALGQALELAAPRGVVRWFMEGDPEMAAMLHELARQNRYEVEVGQLLGMRSRHSSSAALRMSRGDNLTDRELEVIALLAQGLTNKEIAGRLGISEYTVRNHCASIYDKLGVRNRREAGRIAGSFVLAP